MSAREVEVGRPVNPRKAAFSRISEADKENIAKLLYYDELETIRRVKPLLDPEQYPIDDVKVLKIEPKKEPKRPVAQMEPSTPTVASSSVTTVIELLSSPEEEAGGKASVIDITSSPEDESKKSGGKSKAQSGAVPAAQSASGVNNPDQGYAENKRTTHRYHDMASNPGEWPSPTTSLRFDVARFKKNNGWAADMETTCEVELCAATADLYADPAGDQEAMIHAAAWGKGGAQGSKQRKGFLLRGFPMVEDVVFMRNFNYWGGVSSGACYWSTLALLIYGDPSAWLRVKSEHLKHFERVLRSPKNPRHKVYRELNEKWYRTTAGSIGGKAVDRGAFDVNLWQVLNLPGVYVPMSMTDITADLYNVFMVVFSYDNGQHPNTVYETRMRGAYNSRHLFLLYTVRGQTKPLLYC